ncbi:unannotated protein [freshwater metagenome]|uniref:Unannotated protein n=1 Tax=freshwater metagenome TaxID=449393 RepID=A0A6J6ZLD9_9ZZZZ
MHHRERERSIRTREWLEEGVRLVSGRRANRVDDHHTGAGCPGLLHEGPEVAVGHLGVRAPEQDEPAVADVHRVDPVAVAVGCGHALSGCGTAYRPGEPGGAEPVEETLAEGHGGEHALVAGARHGHHGGGAVLVDGAMQSCGDRGERFVPRDALEARRSLGPHPSEWVQHAVRAVHPVEEVVDLRAQLAARERVRRVPAQLGCYPVLNGHHPAAGVGTVVVARAQHDLRSGAHSRSVRDGGKSATSVAPGGTVVPCPPRVPWAARGCARR